MRTPAPADHKVDTGRVELLVETLLGSRVAMRFASGVRRAAVRRRSVWGCLGHRISAVMDNREEAIATGINVHRVSAVAFAFGPCISGCCWCSSGFFHVGSISWPMGEVTVMVFAVIVIGSLGNPAGDGAPAGIVDGIGHVRCRVTPAPGPNPALTFRSSRSCCAAQRAAARRARRA